LQLRGAGRATKAIARDLGVPRSTVQYWFGRGAGVAQSAEAIDLKSIQCGFESHHQHQHRAYADLLGMYLGDGHIVCCPRTYVLRVFLNQKQCDVIDRVKSVISTLLPHNCVSVEGRRHAAVAIVRCYSQAWPVLFPQHGPGRKHTRPIVLEAWQCEIVQRHPEQFLRGCIESDGSRHRRIVRGRNYPAYSFSNRSSDILCLFKEACQLVGLHPCRASSTTISIARRADVAPLDVLFAKGAQP